MANPFFNNTVAIIQSAYSGYPSKPPFEPDELFGELSSFNWKVTTDSQNKVYRVVREALIQLGMDADNVGTKNWNPFGMLIKPGDRVVIKPNFAFDHHRKGETVLSMIIHASVLRPILDYVQIALKGYGELTVADAPVANADFENICRITKIRETLAALNEYYRVKVRLVDLRKMVVEGFEQNNLCLRRIYQRYGKSHSRVVNIGSESSFYELGKLQKLFYGADFDRRIPQKHHQGEIQEYSIATDVLDADVIISVPKLKTHKSAGVTLNIKNMIGINTDKNFVPHYRIGEPLEGGDEFPISGNSWLRFKSRFARSFLDIALGRAGPVFTRPLNVLLNMYRNVTLRKQARNPEIETADLFYKRFLNRPIRSGHWWGNDTLWRVGSDLNKILIYADKSGILHPNPQRRYFSIIDGIIAGEGKGPMVPVPRKVGIILAGYNCLAVDIVATGLMGFDYRKIPIVYKLLEATSLPLFKKDHLKLRSNVDRWRMMPDYENSLRFNPAPGWKGHIEFEAGK